MTASTVMENGCAFSLNVEAGQLHLLYTMATLSG